MWGWTDIETGFIRLSRMTDRHYNNDQWQTAASSATTRLDTRLQTSVTKVDVRHATKLSNFVAQLCCSTKLPVWHSEQWWANPNRDWDLNRDLRVFGEWFNKYWDWFGMRDWDLIWFGIFCDSIRSMGFNSRILASCCGLKCFVAAGRHPSS